MTVHTDQARERNEEKLQLQGFAFRNVSTRGCIRDRKRKRLEIVKRRRLFLPGVNLSVRRLERSSFSGPPLGFRAADEAAIPVSTSMQIPSHPSRFYPPFICFLQPFTRGRASTSVEREYLVWSNLFILGYTLVSIVKVLFYDIRND